MQRVLGSSTAALRSPTTATAPSTQIRGYVAGTWTIDKDHSDVGFTVRHLMVSKARGRFHELSGRIVTDEDPSQSSVEAEIDLQSIDTGNEQRDGHIRSVLDVAQS